MVHFGVYTRVVMKALMEFDRRYIAKKLMFAVFDLPLGLIWKGGGSSISSVNMVQTVPKETGRLHPSEQADHNERINGHAALTVGF